MTGILQILPNEALYTGLCNTTIPIDVGLQELQRRLRPIIISESRPYLQTLSWSFDDALSESMILLWELIQKRSFDPEKGIGFHNYFAKAWRFRLVKLFSKAIRSPIISGNTQIEFSVISVCSFHPKAEEYRQKHNERSAAANARKREQRPPKPMLTPEKRQEACDRKNARQRAYRAAETPEHRRERLDRQKAHLAAQTPEEREARLEKMRQRARNRQAAETPEEREIRLAKGRAYRLAKRAAETPEERDARRKHQRDLRRAEYARETPEQHEARLARIREQRARKKRP